MKLSWIFGWALLCVIGIASNYLSELVVMGGKHPLEASALAVIIGLLIRNASMVPGKCMPGVESADKLLVFGVVLLGASLDFSSVGTQAPAILGIIIGTMVLSFGLILFLGRIFRLSEGLALLLACGTTICGTSAIAVTAPLIKAKQEETSYAIATVALFGLIAILLYPYIGYALHLNDITFGVFAGTAIHSTPQVVGAGYIFSDIAGQTATGIKLVRNCFMAPLAMIIGIWYAKKFSSNTAKVDVARAFPWFLFGYFLMAWCSTKGYFTKSGIDAFSNAGKFLVLLGMAGVGLSTQLSAFKQVGVKPLVVGMLGSVVVATVSAMMICVLL